MIWPTSGVLQTVLANEDAAASPLVLSAAGQLLATSALTALGGTPAERRVDRADAAPATVRRAVAYMQPNAHLDIGVVGRFAAEYRKAYGQSPHRTLPR